ncbi:helix-turn-helix domain-containing protein [Streptomyces sp. NPDC050485]|uniref:helix-turn-helix domain-containing protein n=1 Tax=Streptomyces sp. NPDC050485 TaxID=3365617 RepID=UPI0037AD60E8
MTAGDAQRRSDALAQDIIDRYLEGETASKIGLELGVGERAVFRVLKRHEVPVRGPRKKLPLSNAEICQLYLDERQEIQMIAKSLGVSRHTIALRLTESGVRRPVGHRRMDLPDAEIVARYDAGESIQSLANAFGVSRATVKKRIKER